MKSRLKSILIALASLTAAFGMQMPASALTISPPMNTYTLNPGDTVRDIIKLTNEESMEITLYPQIYNFTSVEGDETTGTPDFYDPNEVRNGRELAPWITMSLEPITLPPGSRYNLEYAMSVPADAQPGSHFGSIQLHNKPGVTDGSAIGLVGGTGVLIFARVSGDVRDELSVSSFATTEGNYSSLPADFNIRLENKGNTHLIPVGNIFVKNAFGRQVASLQVNEELRSILPTSARRFEESWFKRKLNDGASEFTKQWSNFAFGPYEATLVLTYGPDNKIVTAVADFWVFPWMVVLTLLGGLLVILLILTIGLKSYNKALIRRYEAKRGSAGN